MSGYIGNGPGRGQRQAFSFTATASQTTFSGKDSIGLTLTYKPKFIDVYVNGLCIPPSEYTATDGSSIVFGFGLNAGDVVYVVAMSAFDVANALALDQNGADISDKAAFRTNLGILAPKGHLFGLTLSNNSTDAANDIDIATGEAADAAGNPMMLVSSITKRLDALWAVGSGNGGLDTGSIADGTYHLWLVQRSDTGVVDVLFSASATSPAMPTNYDRKRRIGSIIRASGAIVAFTQKGDTFLLITPQVGSSQTNPSTAYTATLSYVPTGVNVDALLNATYTTTSGAATDSRFRVSSLDQTNATLAAENYSGGRFQAGSFGSTIQDIATLRIRTNTSAQVRVNLSASGASVSFGLGVQGWVDDRGRLN